MHIKTYTCAHQKIRALCAVYARASMHRRSHIEKKCIKIVSKCRSHRAQVYHILFYRDYTQNLVHTFLLYTTYTHCTADAHINPSGYSLYKPHTHIYFINKRPENRTAYCSSSPCVFLVFSIDVWCVCVR